MALLSSYKNLLAISLNQHIIIVKRNKNFDLWSVVPVPCPVSKGGKGHVLSDERFDSDTDDEVRKKDEEENEEEEDVPSKKGSQSIIDNISISPNGQLLAVTTKQFKRVNLYKITEESEPELILSRRLTRASSVVAFSPDNKTLLVADKTGDCFAFDCVNLKTPGKWIFGHMSIVLDVLFTPDKKFIVTSDRDEKIRVTNFPDCDNIESYCMGHLEYVSAVALLPTKTDVLLSLSGDKTLRFWKMLTGIELKLLDLPGAGYSMAIQQVNNVSCHLAVVLLPLDRVVFYKVDTDGIEFDIHQICEHSFEGSSIMSLEFNEGNLYLSIMSEDNIVSVHEGTFIDEKYEINPISRLNETILNHIANHSAVKFEMNTEILFKKKFDNVKEYQDRKKRRLECKGT